MRQHGEQPHLPHERGLAAHVRSCEKQEARGAAKRRVIGDEIIHDGDARVPPFHYVNVRLKELK